MTTQSRLVQILHAKPARHVKGSDTIDSHTAHALADTLIADGISYPGNLLGQDTPDEIDRMAAVIRHANANLSGAEAMYDEEVLAYATALSNAGFGDLLEARVRELARTESELPEVMGVGTGQQAFFRTLKWLRSRRDELRKARGAEISVSPAGAAGQMSAMRRDEVDGFEGNNPMAEKVGQ